MGNRLSKMSLSKRPETDSLSDRQVAYYLSTFIKENLITDEEREIIISTTDKKAVKQAIFGVILNKDDKSAERMLEILRNDYLAGLTPRRKEKASVQTEVAQEVNVELPICTPSTSTSRNEAASFDTASRNVGKKEFKRQLAMDLPGEDPFEKGLCESVGHHYSQESSLTSPTILPNFPQPPPEGTSLVLRDISKGTVPWLETSLRDILFQWRNEINEVIMADIQMEKTVCNTYDMTILSAMLKNVTTLTVHSLQTCRFSFPLKNLSHVKYLRLFDCNVYFERGDMISPIALELKDCMLCFTDKTANRTISNYIDFTNMEELIICEKIGSLVASKLKIELKGDCQLDLVILSNVKILNWSTSTWKVDSFALSDSEISGKSHMKIKELSFDYSLLTLKNAPTSVERLVCRNFTPRAKSTFPKLKYVYVSPKELESVKYFQNCSKMTSLEISGDYTEDYFLSTQFIPKNLKLLIIKGDIALLDDYILKADVIIGDKFSVDSFRKLLSVTKSKRLVWLISQETQMEFENEIVQIIKSCKNQLVIGPFKWDQVNYEATKLSKMVNKQSVNYMFIKNRGWAINQSQFNELLYNV